MSQNNISTSEVRKLKQTELSRVEALLEQGKINNDEAALLIDALVETVDTNETSDIPRNLDPLTPKQPTPPEAAPPPPAPFSPVDFTNKSESQAAESEPTESEPTQWLSVKVGVGSVTIKGKDGLSKPVIKRVTGISTQSLQENNGNYSIAGGFSDMTVEMPSSMGLKLNVTAGDAKVKNIAFLKGNNSVGSVSAKAIGGLDFQVDAGEFTASALLATGQHRLGLKAGSAKLELLAGSSLDVTGSCNLGSFKVPESFSSQQKNLNGSFEGTIGTGPIGTSTAKLAISVQAGEIRISEEN